MDFFNPIPALNAEWHRSGKNSMDVEFKSLEDLSAAIDLCQKLPDGLTFFIRSSFKNGGNLRGGRGGRGGRYRGGRGGRRGGYDRRGGRGGRGRYDDSNDKYGGVLERRGGKPRRRFEDAFVGTLAKPGSGNDDKKEEDSDEDPVEALKK